MAVGFISAARPAQPDAIARHVSRVVRRELPARPGTFHDRAVAAGATVMTAPLLRPDAPPPTALVELVLDRFAAARALSRAA
ncbi:hypothetical protein GCM10023152_00890 [Agromyces bauzanensis]|uniref:Sirohydrochlorin chelatase n=1 Tax=Agromyces bauzanensis TaxID=1308924 RepID=A0A917PI43_9MICO|nr:hypothetical protein GCM10011372_17150 [Agromyces bauzanensis]